MSYPLESISIKEASDKQFRLVDCITHYFKGEEILTQGDLGVHQPENEPVTTSKVEKTIAEFFNTESCILVRGAGTGAIRYGLSSIVKANDKILVHKAPVYSTTSTSFEMLGINKIEADFNDLKDIKKVLEENKDIKACLIQHTRQVLDDSYNLNEVISTIKSIKDIPIIVDDNYAVMKVDKIGVELNADLSAFSSFKLQGPVGVGILVGKKKYIDYVRKMHYSGGCQVQGYEALEVLRGLIYAPVMLAITANEANKVTDRLNNGEIKEVGGAEIANAQSKVILVTLRDPIAKDVLKNANELGALPNPVGAESKFEMVPLFYKVSGTMLKSNPDLINTTLRINCNRAGADTVIRILKEAIDKTLERR